MQSQSYSDAISGVFWSWGTVRCELALFERGPVRWPVQPNNPLGGGEAVCRAAIDKREAGFPLLMCLPGSQNCGPATGSESAIIAAMLTRPPPELTLTSYRLPPSLAERVADLPEEYQAALARMVHEIGEEGLDQVVRALAPGGRSADYIRRLPLLRQMAVEMLALNPNLGCRFGGGWCKGMYSAAARVVNSPIGKAETTSASVDAASLKKWLVREWKTHGRRLLQECRAAELARAHEGFRKWAELAHEMAASPFAKAQRQMQAFVDKIYPHSTRTIGSK